MIAERAEGPDLEDMTRLIRYCRKHGLEHKMYSQVGLLAVWVADQAGGIGHFFCEATVRSVRFLGPDGAGYNANRELVWVKGQPLALALRGGAVSPRRSP